MTSPVSEATWRNRFILINLVRIGGTALVLLGLVIWQGDAIVEGGSLAFGFPLTIIGLIISFYGPRPLVRRWRTPPSP